MPRTTPHIAHRTANRLRVKLPKNSDQSQLQALVDDLSSSKHVKRASLQGSSLIVEHTDETHTLQTMKDAMQKHFKGFNEWSTAFDEQIAEYAEKPWVNKTVPLGFLGLAGWAYLRDGAFLGTESAFAIAYLAFDIYWKFQQENVIRKIEKGLSDGDKELVKEKGASAS